MIKQKIIKDFLLKSGIPLETSVSKILQKYNFEDFGEVRYERDGKIFSTDINASKYFKLKNKIGLAVKFVIECKYRSLDRSWIFSTFPISKKSIVNMRFDCNNVVFDEFLSPSYYSIHKVKKNNKNNIGVLHKKNLFNLPIVNKGIELYKGGFVPDSINEAVSQVVNGTISTHKEDIQFNIEMLEDMCVDADFYAFGNIIASATFPIIITTAKIFKMKNNVTLETIEKSITSKQIIKEVDGVLLTNTNFDEDINFSKKLFDKNPLRISSRVLKKLDKHITPSIKSSYEMLPVISPGYIYIINYNRLEKLLKIADASIKSAIK